MKAAEYCDKYASLFQGANEERCKELVGLLAQEFAAELQQTIKTRHIKLSTGLDSAIREQNDKWNAMVRLFEKKLGASPVVRNGFASLVQIAKEEPVHENQG